MAIGASLFDITRLINIYFRTNTPISFTRISMRIKIRIRIGRVAVQWELHGFRIQIGWGRVEVGWIRTSSDAHTTILKC